MRCTPRRAPRDAAALAERVMASMPGDAPILVNSAGCGAAMKEYGQPARHRGGPSVQRPCSRHRRVARRTRRPAPGPDRRRDRRSSCRTRAICVTSSEPTNRCGHCSPTSPTWSNSTTTVCAVAPAAPTRRCSPKLAGEIRDRKVASIERARAGPRPMRRGEREPRLLDASRRGARSARAPPGRHRRRSARRGWAMRGTTAGWSSGSSRSPPISTRSPSTASAKRWPTARSPDPPTTRS